MNNLEGIKLVMFDLDGTLLPMDMDEFTKFYKELAEVDPANPTNSTVHLTNVSRTNTRTDPFVDIPIHKTIVK